MKYLIIALSCLHCYSTGLKPENNITLSSGDITIEIDPQVSGRIVLFAIDGINVLTGKEIHPTNYGSTLWPAPQSVWHWPPYKALDNDPYQLILHNSNEVLLRSEQDPQSGLQFTKHFLVKKKQLQLTYSIKNISAEKREVGPWEVTRVDTSGRAFFPLSGEDPLAKSSLENIEIRNNYLWFNPDFESMEKSQKYYGYGKGGYLAWVTGNVLFVKQFPDVSPDQPAPGQAEVEIFAHAEYPYLELENHGPYVSLLPGESLDYQVTWHLQKIPESLNEDEIIKIAESLIK